MANKSVKAEITSSIQEQKKKRLSLMEKLPVVGDIDDKSLRNSFLAATRAAKLVTNRFPLRGLLGTFYGAIGPRAYTTLLGVHPDDSFISNVKGYLGIITLWGLFEIDIISATSSRVEVKVKTCPLSVKNEHKLCDAYMALEPRLSEADYFNTRITVLECMPDGNGCCRLLFEKK